MEFRVEVKVPEYPFRIGRKNGLLSIGSCFSHRIGKALERQHFNIQVDQYGVLYDPISIAKALAEIAERST